MDLPALCRDCNRPTLCRCSTTWPCHRASSNSWYHYDKGAYSDDDTQYRYEWIALALAGCGVGLLYFIERVNEKRGCYPQGRQRRSNHRKEHRIPRRQGHDRRLLDVCDMQGGGQSFQRFTKSDFSFTNSGAYHGLGMSGISLFRLFEFSTRSATFEGEGMIDGSVCASRTIQSLRWRVIVVIFS